MKKVSLISLAALALTTSVSLSMTGINRADATGMDDAKTTFSQGKDMVTSAATKIVTALKDISGHWAESSILQAVQKGYVEGLPDGRFLPNNQVSRAEFVKMTVAAMGIEVPSTSTGKWYLPYITAATNSGLYQHGDFNDQDWTQSMTREEMATIAVRALGTKTAEEKQWMYLATKQGVITGTAPGVIDPQGTTTRAQAVAVIERVLAVKDGKKLTADKYAVAAAEMYWHKTNVFTVASEIFDNDLNGSNPNLGIRSWKMSNLVLEAPDKHVKGIVNSVTAIDWNDIKDPNRKLLPSRDKLFYYSEQGKYVQLTGKEQAYIVLLDSSLVVNKYPERYPVKRLSMDINGFYSQGYGIDQALAIESKDPNKAVNGLIIPKSNYKSRGLITITVETIPMGSRLYMNTLSSSVVPN